MSDIIFLIGYMGAGKSSIGRSLSKQLNKSFIDLDEVIEEAWGMSIAHGMKVQGELAFRKLEREQLLALNSNAVVSVGGGTPCFYDNMDWMNAHGRSIWLDASPEHLSQRLMLAREMGEDRPLIEGVPDSDLLDFVRKHLFERQTFYAQAHFRVNAAQSSEDILGQILDYIK